MPKPTNWTDHIKDDSFVKNLIVLILILFIIVSLILLYSMGQLDVSYYRTSIDIAMGIVIGGYLLRTLEGKKDDQEK